MDFPQRTHRPMTHYILEFAAVLLGISASLYAENVQEQQRNERIKNQSLTRIQLNIAQDIADMENNIGSHQEANASCNWVLANKHNFPTVNPDSLGMHCVHCVQAETMFIDNQEEYRTLQNSGLIELIRSDSLVQALQSKYAQHDALIKGLESFISEHCDMGMPVIYKQFSTVSGPEKWFDGWYVKRKWDGSPLPDSFFELLEDVSLYRHNFIPIMEERMAADEQLMRWISAEVGEE